MLRLLGRPHVAVDGEVLTDLPDKAFVLLALLALQFNGVATRDQLRTLLWEDATAERAGASLRWLLSKIRRFEDDHQTTLLIAGRSAVTLPESLVIDAAVLRRMGSIESVDELDRVLQLYRGELLSGIDASLDGQLLDTVRRHRRALRDHIASIGRRAADRVGGAKGEQILRQLIAESPDDDVLIRSLLLLVSRERGVRAAETEYRELVESIGWDGGALTEPPAAALAGQQPAGSPEARETETGGVPRIVLLPPNLPFKVDAQTASIADALVEDVSLQLCRMRTFAMFAPHTSRQVAGNDPAAAVAPYGVSYIAYTKLLPAAGSGWRLAVSLVRTGSGGIVFAEQFDFGKAQLAQRFAEVAEAIAYHISGAVERVELSASRRTGAASAYVQYLSGMKEFHPHRLQALRRARKHFTRALELEPGYVPALSAMARTLSKELLALRRTDGELAQRAMAVAEQAAEIDPLDPNAWREKGLASLYLKDIDASLAFLDAASMRAPHHADILQEKADVLVHASRPAEAKRTVMQAISLNPLAPDDYLWTLGSAEFFLGRYEQAVAALLKMQNTDSVSRLIAASAAMAGDLDMAGKYRRRWMEIYPDSRVADFARFMPHASKTDVDHYVDALKRAGFP